MDLDSSIDKRDEGLYQEIIDLSKNRIIWKIIDDFFWISTAYSREKAMATKIQNAFKRMRIRKCTRSFQKSVYIALRYNTELLQLPTDILLYIFKYFEKKDLYKMSLVCKDFNEIAFDRSLWNSYQLRNRKKNYNIQRIIPQIFSKLENLKVLKLCFWASVDEKVIKLISNHVNSGILEELYLDGWERVNDNALSILTGRDPNHLQVESDLNRESMNFDRLPHQMGRRNGLKLLSLGECRNIHCSGIMKLDKLKNLKTLNLLGCVSIKDEGVVYLAKNSDSLESIDLSGTWITSECIYSIVSDSGISLKEINIIGCKKLKSTDQDLLKRNGFNVKSGEDVFRFNLLPEPFSGFKKITQSVLKTRSTLSIYRVYKYLARRIISDMNLLPSDYPENCIDHDEFMSRLNIEIHCNGIALPHHLQLKTVIEKYWDSDELLTLHYRNKEEPFDYSKVKKNFGIAPMKPPIWVPDYISFTWYSCDKEFGMFLRIHHWRACGKSFCYRWTPYQLRLPQYGYYDPVRVCSGWYGEYNPSSLGNMLDDASHRNVNSMIFEAAAELSMPQIIISPSIERNMNYIGAIRENH